MEPRIAAAVVILLIALGSLFGAYRYGRIVERMEASKAHEIALAKAYKENDELKTQLEVQKNEANDAIDSFLTRNPVVKRVFPRCSTGKDDTTTGNQLSAAEVNSALGKMENALGQLQSETRDDAAEWGRAFANCAVMQGWAVSQ